MKGKFEEKNGKLRLTSVVSENVLKSGESFLRIVDQETVRSLIDSEFDKSSYSHPEEVFYADHWEAVYIDEESESAELKLDSSFNPKEV